MDPKPYRRILTLVDFGPQGERVAQRALLLARMSRAELAFLHLAEIEVALDGGYPAVSPKTNAVALEAAALRRLNFMATQLGAGEAECLAGCGPARQVFQQKIQQWQPDLVVASGDYPFLAGSFDVLVLGQGRKSKAGGMLRRLAGWLSSQFQPAALSR